MNRLWWLLVALCTAGVALSVPFLLATARTHMPPFAAETLVTAQFVDALVICAIASYAGIRFAPRGGLDAPWLRAIAERRVRPAGFGSMAIEAAATGSITAVVLTAAGLIWRESTPEALRHPLAVGFWTRASRAFYGGIFEEIAGRWGILTMLIALALRTLRRQAFWAANVFAALLFGALHLPSFAVERIPLTGGFVAQVLLVQGVAGVVWGWMFRRRGLEGAMIAHFVAEVWLHAALPALLA